MSDLTPETRAEWRKDAKSRRYPLNEVESDLAHRILALDKALTEAQRALAAPEKAREEAERDVEGWREQWRKDTDRLEDRIEAAQEARDHFRRRYDYVAETCRKATDGLIQREHDWREAELDGREWERRYRAEKARGEGRWQNGYNEGRDQARKDLTPQIESYKDAHAAQEARGDAFLAALVRLAESFEKTAQVVRAARTRATDAQADVLVAAALTVRDELAAAEEPIGEHTSDHVTRTADGVTYCVTGCGWTDLDWDDQPPPKPDDEKGATS